MMLQLNVCVSGWYQWYHKCIAILSNNNNYWNIDRLNPLFISISRLDVIHLIMIRTMCLFIDRISIVDLIDGYYKHCWCRKLIINDDMKHCEISKDISRVNSCCIHTASDWVGGNDLLTNGAHCIDSIINWRNSIENKTNESCALWMTDTRIEKCVLDWISNCASHCHTTKCVG